MTELPHFTPEKLLAFKVAYEQHKIKDSATFVFDGNEYALGYAKYFIEYLDSTQRKPSNNRSAW